MSLTSTVRLLGEQAKHAPTTLDAGDVRAVCLQMLDVLELFSDIAGVQAATLSDGRAMRVTANIDNDAQPFTVLAGISDQ